MYSLKPLFALAFIILATTVYPQQSYWKKSDEKGLRNVTAQRYIIPDVYETYSCLLYTSPSPRDRTRSRMPSSA